MEQSYPVTRGERILAGACLAGAILVVFIAVDIMTGGMLTRSLTRVQVTPADEAYMASAAEANRYG